MGKLGEGGGLQLSDNEKDLEIRRQVDSYLDVDWSCWVRRRRRRSGRYGGNLDKYLLFIGDTEAIF